MERLAPFSLLRSLQTSTMAGLDNPPPAVYKGFLVTFSSSVFAAVTAILTGLIWNLNMVLISISLMAREVEHVSYVY